MRGSEAGQDGGEEEKTCLVHKEEPTHADWMNWGIIAESITPVAGVISALSPRMMKKAI